MSDDLKVKTKVGDDNAEVDLGFMKDLPPAQQKTMTDLMDKIIEGDKLLAERKGMSLEELDQERKAESEAFLLKQKAH
jgi:hypothetical protein